MTYAIGKHIFLIHYYYIFYEISVELYDSCFMLYANDGKIQFKFPDLHIYRKPLSI